MSNGSLGQRFVALVLDASSETEVADGEVAVGVEHEIGGLEVSMQHVGAVDVLQAPEQLLHRMTHHHNQNTRKQSKSG